MYELDKNIVIANIKEKVFAWTPPKTASVKAEEILKKLGFKIYKSTGNYLIPDDKKFFHNHSSNFFYGHEKYHLMSTFRNPYTLMVSKYRNFGDLSTGISNESFSYFLETWFYGKRTELSYLQCYNYSVRIPDYLIRAESMFEDYSKIPFVRASEYYKSGQLEYDCINKINQTVINELEWKSLYNQNSADMVYYNFAQVFELGKYDRNYWK